NIDALGDHRDPPVTPMLVEEMLPIAGAFRSARNQATEACCGGTCRPSSAGSRAAERLAAWPVLRRCASMPLDEMRSRAVPLRADAVGDGSPRWGLGEVRQALAARGVDYHVCEVAPVDSLVAVATTIAPGLERFSLVRHGIPVVPTGRGWHLWPAPVG
ncbi:MAG TPA: hypothetical protein VGP16_32840, partial [Asanoa sp.]|nr:hypothetical protein [Asanoa sp.]